MPLLALFFCILEIKANSVLKVFSIEGCIVQAFSNDTVVLQLFDELLNSSENDDMTAILLGRVDPALMRSGTCFMVMRRVKDLALFFNNEKKFLTGRYFRKD